MTTNIERAVKIVDDNEGNARLTLARLDRANLIAPDLPEPHETLTNAYGPNPDLDIVRWIAPHGEEIDAIGTQVHISGVVETIADAEKYALSILAAARKARETREAQS